MVNYVVGLSKKIKNTHSFVGSGFFINTEWIVTAKHVLLDLFNLKWSEQKLSPKVKSSVLAVSFYNNLPILWEVIDTCAMLNSDLALIRVKLKQDISFPKIDIPILNLKMPKVEEVLTGIGFPKSKIDNQYKTIKWTLNMMHSTGSITEIYNQLRDTANLNFPCYQLNGDFPPGMSGGPILNDKNEIVGVVCYGLDETISYGASIWPLYMNIEELSINVDVINVNSVVIIRDKESNEIKGINYLR